MSILHFLAAATASLSHGYAQNGSLSHLTIRYTAAPGEANDTVVRLVRGPAAVQVLVRDTGAPVVAGTGFVAVDSGQALATITSDPPNGLATAVALGDHADDLRLELAGTDLGDAYVHGGAGDDRLVVGPRAGGGLTLMGGAGDDLLDAGPGGGAASYVDHRRAVRVDLDGTDDDGSAGERDRLRNIETVWGGAGDDVLVGDAGANRLFGRGGDDTIGGGGGDTLGGEWGNDVVAGGAGADTLNGSEGRDRLWGGSGADRLFGDEGADDLEARDGIRDRVYGGPGRDRARLDAGLDVARGIERRR